MYTVKSTIPSICIFKFNTIPPLDSEEIHRIKTTMLAEASDKNIIYDLRDTTLTLNALSFIATNSPIDLTDNLEKRTAIVHHSHVVYALFRLVKQVYTFKTNVIVTTNYEVALRHCRND